MHTFNLPSASATNTGKLTNTDWNTFNNKENALTFNAPLSRSGNTISLNSLAITNGGTGATTATAALNNLLPSQASNNGKVLQTNGTSASWQTPSGGGTQIGTKATRDAIASPTLGQMFMQSNDYPGLYYWEGTAWRMLSGEPPVTFVDLGVTTTVVNNSFPNLLLNASHHTVYIYGSWIQNCTPEFLELPNPTTCKGRTYKIIINNYRTQLNNTTQPFRIKLVNFNNSHYFPINKDPNSIDSPAELIYDGRATILQSNGVKWMQIQDDKIVVAEDLDEGTGY